MWTCVQINLFKKIKDKDQKSLLRKMLWQSTLLRPTLLPSVIIDSKKLWPNVVVQCFVSLNFSSGICKSYKWLQYLIKCFSVGKFEAVPDDMSPDEILQQVQTAASAASERLQTLAPNSKVIIIKMIMIIIDHIIIFNYRRFMSFIMLHWM